MTSHDLKTWPESFRATLLGHKKHEIRKADRNFKVGDELHLEEWDPETETYTGRTLRMYVSYLSSPGTWGLPKDVCVMSLRTLP